MGKDPSGSLYFRGLSPSRIVEPHSLTELKEAVRQCIDENQAFAPVGGGTMLGLGFPPRRLDVAIRLNGVRGLLEYNPPDFTVSAAAGTTLAELEAALAANGQMLPLDAPLPERATIGGVLATGWVGYRAGKYGTGRDLCIGLRAVIGTGAEVKSGGMVVKNVTGYDVTKLHIGALGTLGVISAANFRLLPVASRQVSLVCTFANPQRAFEAALELARAPARYSALVVATPGNITDLPVGAWALLLLWEGSPRAADRALDIAVRTASSLQAGCEQLEDSLSQRLWNYVRDWPLMAPDAPIWASVWVRTRASEMASFLERAATAAASHGMEMEGMLHVLTGIAWLKFRGRQPLAEGAGAKMAEFLLGLASSGRRILVLDWAPEAMGPLPIWGPEPPGLDLMRNIKASFDPKGLINPGRYVGGL